MIELVISVCMISDPQVCKNVHFTETAGNMTPMQCMMQGQQQIAEWANTHPKWQIRRWRCGRVRFDEREI
ncbi:MAG TPA: hypothetical protein VK862_07170 [Afifellaceae bacterium]|nr:hypothetical protein [Afifellaceae bacterium]